MFYASLALANGRLEEAEEILKKTLVKVNSKHELDQLKKDAEYLDNLEEFDEDVSDDGESPCEEFVPQITASRKPRIVNRAGSRRNLRPATYGQTKSRTEDDGHTGYSNSWKEQDNGYFNSWDDEEKEEGYWWQDLGKNVDTNFNLDFEVDVSGQSHKRRKIGIVKLIITLLEYLLRD
jgi:hypothetical protein